MTNQARFTRLLHATLPLLLACVASLMLSSSQTAEASPLQFAPPPMSGGGGFMGAWCAQGDPDKRASISGGDGGFLTLTNENGDKSVGTMTSANTVSAPQWQFVTGTLSGDGSQINWSNGTFWARCGGGGGNGYRINLTGKWFPNGNHSLSCSIQQRHGNLNIQNESGQSATGSFTGKRNITTNWGGNTITGTVSQDGNRIDWSNGTYWVKFRVY